MADEQSTRDRVRALVRDVLENALPADEPAETTASASSPIASPSSETPPRARIISTLPTAVEPDDKPFTRDESSKMVLTEDDLHGLEEGARLRVAEGARLTPLAADIVRERRIELVRRTPRRGSRQQKLVAVGADHGGYAMKEELKQFLAELGHLVRDFGTDSTDAVDYPDFAHSVARAVSEREVDLGIIIDGAGVGSCMTANKVPGVRAAACYSVRVAQNSREHNDANVLTLGSATVSNAEMRDIVRAWLSTEISEERHKKRVAVERQYKC
jgi:ribose 5-phosphate isomerase B